MNQTLHQKRNPIKERINRQMNLMRILKKKKYKKKAKTQYNTTQIIRSPQPITKIFKRKSKKK